MDEQPQEQGELLQRGGIAHDAALIGLTTVANYGLGPLVKSGVEKLQDAFHHDPPPEIEIPPSYDHDR